MICSKCKFHEALQKNEQGQMIGFCHRYPPSVMADKSSMMPPVTSDRTWCGEFKLKPKKVARPK